MEILGLFLAVVGIVIQCIWMILGFRFVNAQEKIASANKKQSDVLDLFVRSQLKRKE